MCRILPVAAASMLLAASSAAHGISIGVNSSTGGNRSRLAVNLDAGESAGIVPQSKYKNIATHTGSGVAPVEENGAGMVLAYTAGGTYRPMGGLAIATTSGDEKLSSRFVFGNDTVAATGVPFTTYDLYVNHPNDAGQVESTSETALLLAQGSPFGSSTVPTDPSQIDQAASTTYIYTQAIATAVASAAPSAEDIRLINLSGSTLTFMPPADDNGLQIVPASEADGTTLPAAGIAILVTAAGLLFGARSRAVS